jgi:hypothetical protein
MLKLSLEKFLINKVKYFWRTFTTRLSIVALPFFKISLKNNSQKKGWEPDFFLVAKFAVAKPKQEPVMDTSAEILHCKDASNRLILETLPIEKYEFGYVQKKVYHQPDLFHEETVDVSSPLAPLVACG